MAASAAWYQSVFGWKISQMPLEGGTPRVRVYDPVTWFSITLCEPTDRSLDLFDHRRTGLDHIAFRVDDEDELMSWIRRLDELDVPHSLVRGVGDLARLVTFEDPDGIQLELTVVLAGRE